MKSLLVLITFSTNIYALGPIKNGEYAGEMTCSGPKFTFTSETVYTVTDSTLLTVSKTKKNELSNLKTFTADANGQFTFTLNSGGTGSGYFTSNGLHFDAVYAAASGEDTLLYKDGSLYLISSATMYGEKWKCEGVFKSRP